MDLVKTTAMGYKKHLSFEIRCDLYYRFYGTLWLTIHSLNEAPGVDFWSGMNSATHVWLFVIVLARRSLQVLVVLNG